MMVRRARTTQRSIISQAWGSLRQAQEGRAFNSLDAQRDACEAYIKSQAHEGWRLIHAIDGAIYEERDMRTMIC